MNVRIVNLKLSYIVELRRVIEETIIEHRAGLLLQYLRKEKHYYDQIIIWYLTNVNIPVILV